MSKSLKKLIDINRLREFKNKLVGTDSAYVQTGAVDQTVAGTKTFSKPIVGSVTGSSGSCTGNAATATRANSAANADTATNATNAINATNATNSNAANQLQAFVNDNFTEGNHYVKAIRSSQGWSTHLWMCYNNGAKMADEVSVNYATNSGYTNWLRTSSHTDHLFHTEWDGSYFWTYVTAGDGGYRAVRVERSNSSGYADSAGSATKLATARTIALSGAATGTATAFDGSGNITIPVTSLDASKLTGTASVSTTGNAATATTATTATNATYANWLRTSSHTDHLFHTEWDGAGYFWTYVTTGGGEYRPVRVARSDSAANADHATSADSATNASHATSADSAANADHATSADSATRATTADRASAADCVQSQTSAYHEIRFDWDSQVPGYVGLRVDATDMGGIVTTYSLVSDIRAHILSMVYPVGSVYISVNDVSPEKFLGGTWIKISQGRVLQGASGTQTAGTEVSAGLPNISVSQNGEHTHTRGSMNITGTVTMHGAGSGCTVIQSLAGAFYGSSTSSSYQGTYCASGAPSENYINFSADRTWTGSTSSDGAHSHNAYITGITGNSTTVQPPALLVNIWKRTA